VAILSTDSFDETTVNVTTVIFRPVGAPKSHGEAHIEDVNGDGLNDMVLHFKTQQSGTVKGDTEACITGSLIDETEISGCDSISAK